ncbi:MAG: hypothetical protein QW356_00930 [Candidatus Hadarchaeales archaeon]
MPLPLQQWDKAGRGRGISIDVYSSVRKEYFVTDGKNVVRIPAARLIRVAAPDAAPDSSLRVVRPLLSEEWQALLGEELRLPPPPARGRIVFKAVRVDEEGTIPNLYDPNFPYKLGAGPF